jgi:hypothetical protein
MAFQALRQTVYRVPFTAYLASLIGSGPEQTDAFIEATVRRDQHLHSISASFNDDGGRRRARQASGAPRPAFTWHLGEVYIVSRRGLHSISARFT